MEVFRIVFDKCTTVANTIKGFKKSGVFPWDPTIINDKKLTPSTMFENQSQLPDVTMSINEVGLETGTMVLANTLRQFGIYNIYKDDKFGLDLVQDGGPNNGVKLHKILPKHSLIWVVSNPLPQVNAPEYRMYEVNPNSSYKCFKYTKGFVGIRVSNVANYKEIIEILNRNWVNLS